MVTYAVIIPEIEHIASEMGGIANKIQTTLEELYANTTSAMAEWSNDARTAYDAAYQSCSNHAADMAAQAARAQVALVNILENYGYADRTGVRIMGG